MTHTTARLRFTLLAAALLCSAPIAPPVMAAPSVKALTKAADKGDKAAMYALGLRYLNGDGVAKDPAKALFWFRSTVFTVPATGHAQAEYELGKASETGNGVEQYLPEAFVWYHLAARHDPQYAPNAAAVEARMTPLELAQGRYKLAGTLSEGVGAPVDLPAAFGLYMMAAEQGYREAQHMVGFMHDRGLSTPVNHVEAARWYRLAADQDWHTAQHNLARMYDTGAGVPQDIVEAWKWHHLASRDESFYAPGRLYVEKRMTPEQIAEGKARAGAWQPAADIKTIIRSGGRWP